MTEEQMKAYVKKVKLLPLFYHDDITVCKEIIKALYAAGIRCIEFTNRGPKALENFKLLLALRATNYPDLVLAIGTIQHQKEAEAFIEAGADFLISPFFDQSIADVAYLHKKLWIPGCMTSTEIHQAELAGCDLIKLFPGNVLGPGFVKAIKGPLPNIKVMVTGGVEPTQESIQSWLKAGANYLGMGSQLFAGELKTAEDFSKLSQKVQQVLSY